MKSQKNLKKVFLMTLLAASALGLGSSAYAIREGDASSRITDDQGEEPETQEEHEDHQDPEEAQE